MDESAGEETATDDAPVTEPAEDHTRTRPSRPGRAPPATAFGWRGWLLVGMVLLAFLAIPGAILAVPAAQGVVSSLGLSLRDAYLVLPLPAAILLGAMAVWAAVTSRRE
jgi:hypothetical protein